MQHSNSRSPSSKLFLAATLALAPLLGACGGGGGGGSSATGQAGALGALIDGGLRAQLDGANTTLAGDLGSAGLHRMVHLALDPKLDRLYGFDDNRGVLVGAGFDGNAAPLGQPQTAPAALVVDPATGDLFGFRVKSATQYELLRFDLADASFTVVGPCPRIVRATFDANAGRLIAVTPDRKLVLIDPTNGAASTLYADQDLAGIQGLAHDPQTGRLFAARGDAPTKLVEISLVGPGMSELVALDRVLVDLVMDSDSGRWFGLSAGNELVAVDADTGATTALASLGRQLGALTRDGADGRYFAVDASKDELVKLDPVTDTVEPIGALGMPVHTLAYDGVQGKLWGVESTTRQLVDVDPTTGAATIVPGWTFYPGTLFAIDPQTGDFFAYEADRDITLLVDPSVPKTTLIKTAVLNTFNSTYGLSDLTFDAELGLLVGCGYQQTDEGGGSSSFTDVVVAFDAVQGSPTKLEEGMQIAPVGIGYDPLRGLLDLSVPGQPLFVLERGSVGPDYRSDTGLWDRPYRSAVRVDGSMYATNGSHVYRLAPDGTASKLVGGVPQGVTADDLVYDPASGYLGYHRDGDVIWASPTVPFAIKATTTLQTDFDTVVCDPELSGVFWGIVDGALYREDTLAGTSQKRTLGPPMPGTARAAVLGDGVLDVLFEGRELVRYDLGTGAYSSQGTLAYEALALFRY